jgi:hypothetical protein
LVAVLGLIIAPLARPAAAMAGDMASVSVDVSAAADSGMAMPEDMPCCPDKAPVSDCSKTCPLMALCMSGAVPMPASFEGPPPGLRQGQLVPLRQEPHLSGLGSGPPTRPPKI